MTWDLILVGGGLTNSLLAYRLSQLRPELKVLILEKTDSILGNHTWSFHRGDLTREEFDWMSVLIDRSWSRYEVKFPKYSRIVKLGYCSVRSESLTGKVMQKIGNQIRTASPVKELTSEEVYLEDGTTFRAKVVLDGRGGESMCGGFQKFVGLYLETEKHHGIYAPILMDATCTQEDGFRFFYLLPWSERALLVEDTHYSLNGSLDVELYRQEIVRHIERQGWKIRKVISEEVGLLPIPTHRCSYTENAIGMRGGFFHPTTGYSLPDAVRLIGRLSRVKHWSSERVLKAVSDYKKVRRWNVTLFLGLNRMLFGGLPPDRQYEILQRFYRLPERVVSHFYGGNMTVSDWCRFFIGGKPPVSVGAAIKLLRNKGTDAKLLTNPT